MPFDILKIAKQLGFSDEQIARFIERYSESVTLW